MSDIQGLALLWLRRSSIVTVTLHGVEGARQDRRGIWIGLDDIDPDTYRRLDHWADDDARLADFIQSALIASRYLIPLPPSWLTVGAGADQPEQNRRLAAAFGLKGTGALFDGMKACIVRRELDEVRFIPKKRLRGGVFDTFDPPWRDQHPDVVLDWSAPPGAWLEAAKLCLSRCL